MAFGDSIEYSSHHNYDVQFTSRSSLVIYAMNDLTHRVTTPTRAEVALLFHIMSVYMDMKGPIGWFPVPVGKFQQGKCDTVIKWSPVCTRKQKPVITYN